MNVSRRVVISVVASAIVVGGGVAAVVARRGDEPRRVHVAASIPRESSISGGDASTSSSTSVSTSSSTLASTSVATSESAPATTPPTVAPTAPGTTSDTSVLVGSITVDNPTLIAEEPAAFTLTITNTSDQTFHDDIKPRVHLSVLLMGTLPFPDGVCSDAETSDFTMSPHEQRKHSLHITPTRHMLGPAELGAALLYDGDTEGRGGTGGCIGGDAPGRVPKVAVTIVPPGWVEGQPLDAAQGRWLGQITLAVQEAHVGDTVTVPATVKNTGQEDQSTRGFGSLVADCHGSGPGPGLETMWWRGAFFPATVVRPGQTATMSFDIVLEPGFVGTAVCSVEMAFNGDLEKAEYNRFLEAPWNSFGVLDAG